MATQFEYKKKLQEYFNSEDYEGARKFLLHEEGEQDVKAEIFYDLSRIEKWDGNYKKAIEFIQKAIELNPQKRYYFLEYALQVEKINLKTSIKTLLDLELIEDSINLAHKEGLLVTFLKKFLQNSSETIEDHTVFQSLETLIAAKQKKDKSFPLITIIILGYNKVRYTQKCLNSVLENTNYPNFEIIFLDNASTDETSTIVESYGEKVKYIRSKKNLGFVNGNNYAARFSKGEYLVFLNNDTEVKKEWLNSLYNTFVFNNDAGAVGSKLIYPDGRLQEAGGVIFNDATGWNFGRGDDPNFHLYDFTREVDYCSGASLMVKKSIFEELGGFDQRFAPAYYEDTDLCFSVRKLGFKVYYCHSSVVVHHEGATAGTDLNKGFKKYQVINRPKFIEKWKEELNKQYPPDPNLKLQFFNRNKAKKILIIDDIPPLPNQAAGALRHYHTLKQMLNLGYQVTYVHLMGKNYLNEKNFEYFHEFKMRGVEFIWFNYEYWWEFRNSPEIKKTLKKLVEALDLTYRKFDYIYIAFWHIAEYFIDFIRSEVPHTPILIDTMDIHFLREIREAELKNDAKLLEEAKRNKKRELTVYQKADCVTTVTLKDREILQKELPQKPIFILTDVHDPIENIPPFEKRKDLLFVGNFNHKPNEDAVVYFAEEIFPQIQKELPEIKFYIVGNNPTKKILALQNKSIIVTGWVPKVEPFINQCRIEVIPLRFGAGNKGKVGQALANGIPIVSTSIGTEGMGIKPDREALIADNAEDFAKAVIKLYNNKDLWEKLSAHGKELIGKIYSSRLMRERLKHILSFDNREKLKTSFALQNPEPNFVSVIIPSYNNKEFLEQAVESIFKNDYPQIEIIVVDNNSDKETKDYLKKLQAENKGEVIFNQSNEGFPKAVNQGFLKSNGKFLIVANNDVIVPPHTIGRMVEIAQSNEKIGIVGVTSNYVSGPQFDKEANYKTPQEMFEYAQKVASGKKGKIMEFPRVAFLFTLIKWEVVEKIGGLDERFTPGNFEDDDFCLRAQLAGFKTVIAEDLFVHHYGSKSFKKNNKDYDDLIQRNLQIFKSKWGADPEEIWLQGKEFHNRKLYYPIYEEPFSTHFERALLLAEESDFTFAASEIEKALQALQNKVNSKFAEIAEGEIFHFAGTIFLNAGNYEKALHYFEKELDETPNSVKPLEAISLTYRQAGMEEMAEKVEKIIEEVK